MANVYSLRKSMGKMWLLTAVNNTLHLYNITTLQHYNITALKHYNEKVVISNNTIVQGNISTAVNIIIVDYSGVYLSLIHI